MKDCGFTDKEGWFRYRAAAIIIEDGHVLVAKNEGSPYYYSVGGAVHLNETAEDAVRREVFEETGVNYEVDRLAVIHENFFDGDFNGLRCHEVAFYFLMKPRGKKEELNGGSISMNDQRETVHWLPIYRLNEYYMYPTFFKDKLQTIGEKTEHIVTIEEK